jgi:hypothetical protein
MSIVIHLGIDICRYLVVSANIYSFLALSSSKIGEFYNYISYLGYVHPKHKL